MLSPLETFVPADTYDAALRQACALWGVQENYWDIFGNHHVATTAVLGAILTSLGVPADSTESLNQAIDRRLWEEWSVLVPPVHVTTVSEGWVPVNLASDGAVSATFCWESGGTDTMEVAAASLLVESEASLRGQRFVRKRLRVPSGAPLGYHTVNVKCGGATAKGRVILCPDRAFKPEFLERGGKAAGVGISLYGLRSERNWGCGDFTDLAAFIDWAARDARAAFVAVNPLHSIPNRQPYNTSPYLPNSSFYRNALYLDIEKIEDVQRSELGRSILSGADFEERLEELRASEYVEYERVWALKQKFLKLAFREFLREYRAGSARAERFRRYAEAEGEPLEAFAVYQALDEVMHKRDRKVWIWPQWPEEFRDAASPAVREFAREHPRLVLFYKYVQWQVDEQLAAAQKHAKDRGMSIGLYHDLALATDRCGSDLWAYGSFYVSGCRVGSPPDDFSPKGQDWAFPPPNSVEHHRDGYRHFVDSIRKNCTHGGALRIDHVMRFFRLFWIPDGKEAVEGVYVRDYADDLVRILTLESVRNRVVVIGEDLGTVEPYIRVSLEKHGILSYRLLYFERHKDGSFKRPEAYPRQALVSVSTHDLPTLVGFWTGEDIKARRAAGVIDDAGFEQQRRSRETEKQRMLDVMFELRLLPEWFPRRASDVLEFTGELHNAAVGFLAGSPSELMLLNQEDLFKEVEQQNLPGTTEQYPNWRHKMRYTVEELRSDRHAGDCTSMFRTWLERTGRLTQARA
jgi:4-alpha-glucanotransferase